MQLLLLTTDPEPSSVLVAQHEDLDLFGSVSARQQQKQLEDVPQHQVGKGAEHSC
jgi:hypothetical protein